MVSGLKARFALRENIFLSKALSSMACFLPPLLPLALLSSPLMPNIWHYALTGFLEGPAFAFLLLNCVIATIIGASKLQSERRVHEAESPDLVAGFFKEDDEKGKGYVHSNSMQQCFRLSTPLKHGHNHHKKKGESLLRRCSSLNGSSDYQTKHEQVKVHFKKEKKSISSYRARLASRRSDKAGHFSTKPMGNEVQKRGLIKGSLTSFYTEANSDQGLHEGRSALTVSNFDSTADDHCTKGHSSTGHAVGVTDHQRQQAESPAPAAPTAHMHPSMDEVWAAIMASRKSDDCMASCMHAEKPGKKRNSKIAKQPLPATSTVAPTQAPAPSHTQPAAAATAATSRRAAEPKPAGMALAAPRVRRVQVESEEEIGCDELKELNRRAEQFISRFNQQMRLQREESWQRQNRERCLLPLSL